MTNLKRLREAAGLSQSQLAKAADLGLKGMQCYEQKTRDINKAQAGTLYRLAKVLNCSMEDLLELDDQPRP